ncbi:MAG: hypothetical protein RIN56_03785 [Sporomusaceae bacterium]|nr:hypothetical protein [Sporomusaceae bacterium]
MAENGGQKGAQDRQVKGGPVSGQQADGPQAGDRQGAGVPLSAGELQKAQQLEEQIRAIEQRLEGMSNSELRDIATKLESVERAALLEKIDNELHTLKETIVKPGDAASTASAGASAAAAVVLNE